MTASPATVDTSAEQDEHLDIAALYPADPELMVSPEGDRRGLKELKDHAEQRIEHLRAS
jgi:hypothetical protein